MQVEVQYLAQIKRALGVPGESVELPAGATVGDLLRNLAARHATTLLTDEAGAPNRSLLLFLDDRPTDARQILADQSVLTILAPMAGG
jgi:molybdopterin converting factor small subunit